ncbi:hypothetical protein N5U26_00120 [Aliarcobacter cryaerophilus]|uniref:hypothetical protein n=1 Tax=Aliarcobacter cryaerophilus TaxID=28198 RepID=UPI0021B5A16A|nr:hypothetical protein [Aliarcobacter cryaerophilus]MCT7508755.1 hypothetical protein [Aliarcobacter cryaerophilus]
MRIYNKLDLELKDVFDFLELDKKEYKEYLIKTIKTTQIMLDTLERFKSKRFDKQLKRGLSYLKNILTISNYQSSTNKSLNFLNYLIEYNLLYSSEHSRVLWIIEKLNKNEFSIIVKDEIKRFIIDFEFILDNAKNIDEIKREKSNFIPIIDLLNLPNKNDILISSIYHLTAIQIHNETQKNRFDFEVDFYDEVKNKSYKYSVFFNNSCKLVDIFKSNPILRRNLKNEINIYGYLSKNKRYSYFIINEYINNYVLGIKPNTPHHITGYGSITNYYSYTPYDTIGGLKGYIFPNLDTLEIEF